MPRPDPSPFRLSLQLDDFAASDLFEPLSTTHQRQLAAWLSKSPRAAGGGSEVPAAAVFHAISAAATATPPTAQQAAQLHKIATELAATARSTGNTLSAATGAAALAPDVEAAAAAELRLSFFFLTHLVKLTSSWKDARGAASKPSTAAWQLRSVAFGALVATHAACEESRVAATLVLHAALSVVGHPLPAADADAKSAAEIARRAVCGYMAGLMSPQEGRSEAGAATAAAALLSLLEQPKQAEGVVKEVHRVVVAVMACSALAGCSLVGLVVRRAGGADGGDALAALAAALAATPSPEGTLLRAALVAHTPEIIALLTHPRPAVRKAALDVAAALRGGGGAFWPRLHFASAVRGLGDEDATLRAKACGALAEAGAGVWSTPAPDDVLGVTPDAFASGLAARLADRSVTVRKKVAITVAALAVTVPPPAPAVAQALQRHVVPALAALLRQPRDGKLYPGEAGAALLSGALTTLASSASQDAAGVAQLLVLWRRAQDEAARANFGAAIATACLDGGGPLLYEVLSACSKHGVADLRTVLHADPRLRAQLRAALDRTAELASDTTAEDVLPLCRAIFVLVDDCPGEESARQLEWLLGVARGIARSAAVADPDGAEALHWCLEAAGMCHSTPEQGPCIAGLARELALARDVRPEEVLSAVALLRQAPAPKDATHALLRDLALAAGILANDCSNAPDLAADVSVRGAAATSFLTVLSALSSSCIEEKALFLDNLRAESAAAAEGGPAEYLAEESDAKAQEAAAQKFLDDLLAAQDSVPAAFVPAALELAASPLAGPLDRAEALRALGSLAALSQPLAERCLPIVAPLLDLGTHGAPLVCLAAVAFARAVAAAFPAAASPLLARFAPLLALDHTDAARPPPPPFVAHAAAAAAAALLTSGRLRVHDWMGLVALGIVHSDTSVSFQLCTAFSKVMDAAGSGSERAALVLAVAQGAPQGAREAAATAAVALFKPVDRQADAVVSPCLTAALAAAAAGRCTPVNARVAAALLRPLRPSHKVLRLLATWLEANSTAQLPPPLGQELQEFVRRAVVVPPAAAAEEQGGRPEGERKRGREGKASAAALQAQLLETLAARAAPRPRRHPRI